ncbi:MAG: hypothetical protein HY906_05315 [Deltaproteobacteria bacterium]|nr:hypothetical protein [Deltaproteobacteria bacterium]
MSHCDVTAGTMDRVYGATGAMRLAQIDVTKSTTNADHHEHFADSQPQLGAAAPPRGRRPQTPSVGQSPPTAPQAKTTGNLAPPAVKGMSIARGARLNQPAWKPSRGGLSDRLCHSDAAPAGAQDHHGRGRPGRPP